LVHFPRYSNPSFAEDAQAIGRRADMRMIVSVRIVGLMEFSVDGSLARGIPRGQAEHCRSSGSLSTQSRIS